MTYTHGEKVTIFADGFGELDTIYNAKTDEFVCPVGAFDRAVIEGRKGMNGIVAMKTWWVTFGSGTILHNYCQAFSARSVDIVYEYCRKHYTNLWCHAYETKPAWAKELQDKPVKLYYTRAKDISS